MRKNLILTMFSFLILVAANAQNIGIGTTSPQNKLEINSAIANNSGLRLTQLAGQSDSAGFAAQTINSNFSFASAIAVDASGVVYVADYQANQIYKVTASGSSTPFVTTGLNQPYGMAFDPSGNMYVCNVGTNSVLKISPAGIVSPFASGFVEPVGIVYLANNLYVSNYAGNSINKVSLAGTVTTLTTTATFNSPGGLAFDASGVLYVANSGSGVITKINVTTGASSTFTTFKNNSQPFALKFDASGNLLVGAIDSLYKVAPSGIATGLISSDKFAFGVYIDNGGAIYGIDQEFYKLTAYFNTFLSINNSGDLVLVPNPIFVSGGNSQIGGSVTTNGNIITNGNTMTNGNDTITGNLVVDQNAIIKGNTISNGNDTTNGNLVINGTIDNGYGSLSARAITASTIASNEFAIGSSGEITNSSIAMGDNATEISIAIGQNATAFPGTCAIGNNATALCTNCTAIGNNVTAHGTNSTAMGDSTIASGNYSTAMGTNVSTNNHTGAFTIGDSDPNNTGVTLGGINDQFVSRFNGGYYLMTSGNTNRTGAIMNHGDNSWSAISDSTKKEKILPVDGEGFLNKIAQFKLSTWSYKGQDAKIFRHYGPMAQDFHNAFGKDALGTIGCDTLINQQDFLGVSFIAIQALEKRTEKIEQQQKQISDLQKQNAIQQQNNLALQQQMQSLLNTVASLNKQVQSLAVKTNNQTTVAVNR